VGLKLIDAVGRSGLPGWLKPYAMVWARKANDDGTKCKAGVQFVADYLSKQPGIVRRARNVLIEMGVLEAETVHRWGRNLVKITAFNVDCLPERADDSSGAPKATPVTHKSTVVTDRATGVALKVTPVTLKVTGVAGTSSSTSLRTSRGTSWVETHTPRERQALSQGGVRDPEICDDNDPEYGPSGVTAEERLQTDDEDGGEES
jgi:hypothetical protein